MTARETIEVEEYRHRVANMLQLLLGVLRFQRRRCYGVEAKERLAAVQDFVLTMADINRTLTDSASPTLEQALAAATRQWLPQARSQQVALTFQVEDPPDVRRPGAQRLALVLQEAITNALEHAFPEGQGGDIEVVLTQDQGLGVLLVIDDGIGLPADWTPGTGNVGIRIIRELATSLGGSAAWSVAPEGGTCLRVTFGARPEPKTNGAGAEG